VARVSPPFIVALGAVEASDVRGFGGKATSLSRLIRAGLPVPDGVVVSRSAMRETLRAGRLEELARAALRGEGADDLLRGLAEVRLPAEVAGALREAAERLGPRLVVRSSAVDEDGHGRSFAGQYLTRINVAPGDALEEAVKACWASWFSETAAAYRGRRRIPIDGMAVVVQTLVDARAAGVLFSVNPVTGSWKEIVIEGAWGLGEAVVSGRVAPDRYVLSRPSRLPRVKGTGHVERLINRLRVEETHADVVAQRRRLAPVDGGVDWVEVGRPTDRKLSHADTRRLARAGLRAEALLGEPVDCEWALDGGGRLWMLQARPVTAAGPPLRGEQVLWTRRFLSERWGGQATPMGWSIIAPLLDWFIAYPDTARRYLGGQPPTRLHHGFPYFNVTVFRHLAFKWPGAPPPRFMLDFLPPDEVERWTRRRAVAPDWRVYGSIFAWTWREKRWQRFRWNPWTNHKAWAELLLRLDAEVPLIAAGDDESAVRRVEAGIELVRDYVKVHITSLLFANLFYEVAENRLPRELRTAVLRCPEENLTLRTNRALWELGQGGDREAFFRTFGHRAVSSSWEIFSPRWAERREHVLALAGAMPSDPSAASLARQVETERALAATRRLDRWTREWVRLARIYLQLREDQRFHFDRLLYALKQALEQVGRLRGVHDVRWLRWPELRDGEVAASAGRAERWAGWAKEPPPIFLRGDDAVDEVVGGRVMKGLGISPGRVTGTVRVLASPEAGRLARGDILVAHTTDPGWTPLFSVAGGVVLELGSMLSHGAVVAREYRLPAVVNVAGACTGLRDGQRVTVDGSRGEVRVEDDQDPLSS